MAIPCPGCGREYDVTLFQFGRTIWCTCGQRVGLEKRLGPRRGHSTPEEPTSPRRFLADAMLGRLARWLRALGYDTVFEPDIRDRDAVRTALEEDRTLLTRDRRMAQEWRVKGIVVLQADDPEDQLRELAVRVRLEVRPARLFTRCLRCNTLLEPISLAEVEARIPPRIRENNREFRCCPSCDRIFWEGSHTRRMRRRFGRVLGGSDGA